MAPSEHHQPSPGKIRLPKIVWILPIAAVVITAVSVARIVYGPLWWTSNSASIVERAAPPVALRDQNSDFVRTSRFQGRQRMVVVFFDGVRGPENSNQLLALRDSYSEFQSEGTEVIAISVATPFRNRQGIERAGSFPFPLLSDVDYAVHKMWGLGNAETAGPVEAVFLVDRRGIIRWSETSSDALISPKILLQKLAQIP